MSDSYMVRALQQFMPRLALRKPIRALGVAALAASTAAGL
jgi:hypothetical protein